MGNYEELKQAVSDVIKTNGNQEIIGAVLQNTLLSIISTVGNNATFAGIAKSTTNPGTPDQNVFWIASEPGMYNNFNNIEVLNEVVILQNKNGIWEKKETYIANTNSFNEANANAINALTELYKSPLAVEESVVGRYYHSGKQYATDSYNGFTVDFYNVSTGDKLYISGTKKGNNVACVALLSIKAAETATFVYDIANDNSQAVPFERGLTIPDGITYLAISRPTSTPNAVSVTKKGNESRLDTIKENIFFNEIYFENMSNYEEDNLILRISKSNSVRQITLYHTQVDEENAIANYYVTSNFVDNNIIEIPTWNNSGVKGYVLIDFTQIKDGVLTTELKYSQITSLASNPSIENYLQNIEIQNIERELYYTPLTVEQSVVGKYYKGSTKEYTSDSYNDYTVDFYNVSTGDKLYISGTKKGNNVACVALLSIKAAETATFVYDIANDNSQAVPFERGLTIPDGITYLAISRPTSTPNAVSVTKKGNESRLDVIDEEIKEIQLTNKWVGKRILAIGDSVTAAGQWQNRVGEVLSMNVRTHAKGGIGIIQMVDGDGSGDAPEGYDPDDFGTSTIYALNTQDVTDVDVIVIMGFYNERRLAVSNPGNENDMYPSQNTFIGRLNYAIKRIYEELALANNNKCKVVVCSAHKYGKYPWSDLTGYDDGKNIYDATKKSANYNSLYCIDLMNGGGINMYNWNYYQNSNVPYNTMYIPQDGINNGTNKPFASIEDAPNAADNINKYITVTNLESYKVYKSNGSNWVEQSNYPYPWNGDQLHPGSNGYKLIGDIVAGNLMLL